jgi:hypothetical protein
MRRLLLLLGVGLASCTTAPQAGMPDARSQQELQQLLAGKTAGKPISCLQSTYTNDMQIIDGRNVAFKQGARTVYLMHLSEGCHLLGAGGYALLTHQFGGLGYCQGDIARVFDTTSRMTVGSCGIEQIVPYSVAGAARY